MQTNKDIKSYWFARLSLTTIAALTPPEIEVAITDENVEEIDFNEDVDLVGLTAMTMHAVRAYEIADASGSATSPWSWADSTPRASRGGQAAR